MAMTKVFLRFRIFIASTRVGIEYHSAKGLTQVVAMGGIYEPFCRTATVNSDSKRLSGVVWAGLRAITSANRCLSKCCQAFFHFTLRCSLRIHRDFTSWPSRRRRAYLVASLA